MNRPINHAQWQVLRTVLRRRKAKKGFAGVPGHALRLQRTRLTRDGEFLTRLVSVGLLAVTGRVDPPDPARPEPFNRLYDLTTLGEHAAEYGEYPDEWRPR